MVRKCNWERGLPGNALGPGRVRQLLPQLVLYLFTWCPSSCSVEAQLTHYILKYKPTPQSLLPPPINLIYWVNENPAAVIFKILPARQPVKKTVMNHSYISLFSGPSGNVTNPCKVLNSESIVQGQ